MKTVIAFAVLCIAAAYGQGYGYNWAGSFGGAPGSFGQLGYPLGVNPGGVWNLGNQPWGWGSQPWNLANQPWGWGSQQWGPFGGVGVLGNQPWAGGWGRGGFNPGNVAGWKK